MDENNLILNEIKGKIHMLRDVQIILDSELAVYYGVEIKRLNEQVKRNIDRFPVEFCFQLNENEYEFLRSHFATLKKTRGSHRKYLPYAFTEQGVAMLSGLLNSKIAIRISIQIINAFVLMKKILNSNITLSQRLENTEKKLFIHDEKFDKIFDLLESNKLEVKEGVFFEGQIFDAYNFVSDLIRRAVSSIILIDNYIDDSVLTLFIKRKNKVKVIIYTENISKQLNLDLEKYNSQYDFISIKELKDIHDRFLIIDNEVYHIGASLKDLGKKLFAFSKLEKEGFKIFEKLN